MPNSVMSSSSEIRGKTPGPGWVKFESFLTRIGMLYPQKPFKEMMSDVRIEDGGRRIYMMEENKVKKPRLVNFPQEAANEIGIVTPMNINEAADPADMLRSGRTILCNFHGIDNKNLDPVRFFLMGVVYAIGGSCKKVNDAIYLFTPAHMAVIHRTEESSTPRRERKTTEDEDEILDQMFGT